MLINYYVITHQMNQFQLNFSRRNGSLCSTHLYSDKNQEDKI